MRIEVTAGTTNSVDELNDLRSRLLDAPEFRGRVRPVHRAPEPGAMGGWIEALDVALQSGGALTLLAGAVIVWLKQRKGTITVKLTKDGNSVEISAQRVHGLDEKAVHDLTSELVTGLDGKARHDRPRG